MLSGHEDSLPLQRVKLKVLLTLQFRKDPLRVAFARMHRLRLQFRHHPGDLLLLPPRGIGVDLNFLPLRADPKTTLHSQIVQLHFDQLVRHLQKFRRPANEDLPGQVAAALRQCRGERIEDTASDPELGLRADPDSRRDLIRGGKADPVDILCQLVGVLPQDRVHIGAVSFPYLERDAVGNAVLLQKEHRVPQLPLFSHVRGDLSGAPLADPLDLREPLGLLVHDPQRVVPEFLDDPRRQRLSDALYRAGRQIAQHRLGILGRDHPVDFHLELLPVHGVLYALAGNDAALALADGRRKTGAGQDPVLGMHLKHGICIFFVSVDYVLYISLDLYHSVPDSLICSSTRLLRPAEPADFAALPY